ncbi:hypothetical protein ILUMI_17394, partial [Ignelater luminosus]
CPKSAPKYSEKQKTEQKSKLSQLSENEFAPTKGLDIVMDGESYFIFDGSEIANNKTYTTVRK